MSYLGNKIKDILAGDVVVPPKFYPKESESIVLDVNRRSAEFGQ
jgi:hypothetical protein